MITARNLSLLIVVLLISAAPWVARAETATPRSTGAIEGSVYTDTDGDDLFDPDEAGVAAVTVRLTGEDVDRKLTTDNSGLYRFSSVPNGRYTVTVEPESPYRAVERTAYEGLEVEGDTLAGVDFALTTADADATATKAPAATATTAPVEATTVVWTPVPAPTESVVVAVASPEPTVASDVDGMPQTGVEDLGPLPLLAGAIGLLVVLAGAGWALGRRG